MGLEIFRHEKRDNSYANTDQIELDRSNWCAPHRYAVSMNEACGGCEGCLRMQAEFYGYEFEEPEEIV